MVVYRLGWNDCKKQAVKNIDLALKYSEKPPINIVRNGKTIKERGHPNAYRSL